MNTYVILACVIGLMMTWGVGANDLANIMSTAMGSNSLSVRKAIVIAIVFEFAGAFFGGTHVSNTIRSGIISSTAFMHDPSLLIYSMLAVLLAGTTWMLLASYLGMPVSITNAIVGSLVGVGADVFGLNALHWGKVGAIAISWLTSPLIAGVAAFLLFLTIQRSVFASTEPVVKIRAKSPLYLFLVGVVLTNMIVIKGLAHFGIDLSRGWNTLITVAMALMVTLAGMWKIVRLPIPESDLPKDIFEYVERVFAFLMGLTACAMVFAHGSNDVAIAVGPISAVFSVSQGYVSQHNALPAWVVFMATGGVVLGLVMYGRKVIETVGHNITALTPSRAFCATLAAAATVIVSTSTGIPVSATQTLVGAVLGVGLARGIVALNLTVVRNIFMSWVVTLPAASLLAIAYFHLFHWLFN